MVNLPLSAEVGPVSRMAGHAKRCNLGGSGSSRRYADAPKQPGIRVPLHRQIERSKAQRGREREQVPPRTWKASLTNWSTPQEPLSSTRNCSASGSSCSQTARESSKRSSRFRQLRKLHSEPNSSKSEESSFWRRAGDRARRGQKHRTTSLLDHKRHSTKRARRSSQTNLESISSKRLSKIDPCHTTKRRSQTLSLGSSRLSKLSMDHQTSSALGRRGLGSARDTTSSQGPKRTVTLCPNQDWSWLESRPLRTSSPLTGRQRLQKPSLELGKPRRYPECLPVGPRRTLRQKASSSAAGEHLSNLEAACTEFLLAAGDDWRALSGIVGLRRRAAREGSKETNVRRGKSFAHAARQMVARVWCKSCLLSTVHGNHTAACRRA